MGFYGQKHAFESFDHGRHRQQDGFYGIFMGLSENEIQKKKNTHILSLKEDAINRKKPLWISKITVVCQSVAK